MLYFTEFLQDMTFVKFFIAVLFSCCQQYHCVAHCYDQECYCARKTGRGKEGGKG